MSFVHLHTHSHYSLLDGLAKIDDLVAEAVSHKMPVLALTDHGNLYGAIEFYKKAKAAGIKPIIGCEAYIAKRTIYDKQTGIDDKRYHLVLLAENDEGYQNLLKLVTISNLEGFYYKPRLDRNILRKHSRGLIALSACMSGEIPRALLNKDKETAKKILTEYQEIFGKNNFFIELEHHPGIPNHDNLQKALLDFARENGAPVVAACDAHYLKSEDKTYQEILLAVQTNSKLDDEDRLSMKEDDFSFRSPAEMKELFKEIPEAVENSLKIAERCNVDIKLGELKFPHFEIPEGYKDQFSYFNYLAAEGFKKRFKNTGVGLPYLEEAKKRFEYEISVIKKEGFVDYFLIVQDFVNWAKSAGIIVGPGRGCFLPNTQILMNDGSKKNIQDIKKGDKVISASGKIKKVRTGFKYNINEDICVIKAKMLNEDLFLTKDHKILSIKHKMCDVKNIKETICKPTCRRSCKKRYFRRYKKEWIEAGKLQKNDLLLYPIFKTRTKKITYDLLKFTSNNPSIKYNNEFLWYEIGTNHLKTQKIKRFIELNEGLAKLIGYFISEGWAVTKKRDGRIGFGLNIAEKAYQNEIRMLIQDIFNLETSVFHHKTRASTQIICYSKILGLFFSAVCGNGSLSKKIPEEIFVSEDKIKTALIEGLLNGDGSNKEKMRVSYDSISINLISQIKILLATLGFIASINKRIHKNSNCNVSYKLRLSGEQLFRFNNIFFNFQAKIPSQKFYRNDYYLDDNFIYFPVQNVKFSKHRGEVYDISVEKEHSYVANDIIVHNSTAGSLVAYCLNITDIDPLKYNLLFERFINPERVSPPDIDLDFADTRRDEVINYISKKYGEDKVAQIITFGTMAARAAIRDAGRAMGLSYGFCDEAAKMIPFGLSLKKTLDNVSEFKNLYNQNPEAQKLINSALKLEGVARHASTHACGIVISKELLHEHLPLQLATSHDESGEKKQTVVTQYEMRSIEDLGLLKMDILGLKNLSVIEATINLIKKYLGKDIDIYNLELDDEKIFRTLAEGKTVGVFQLEGGGMTRYLKELEPTNIDDIIAMIGLYRPGPMELVPSYIKRKHGIEKISYLHPKLKPILKNTYGIMIYQEQLMQAAQVLAGISLAEADILRKAIGKKIKKLLDEQKEKIIQGVAKTSGSRALGEKFWKLIEPFAGYGFNKSHTASYALIAYQTAYLKTYYPIFLMASLMNADSKDIDRISFLVKECRNLGIKVLAPDINISDEGFTPNFARFNLAGEVEPRGEPRGKKDAIRFGLKAVKNVGHNVVKAIIEERKNGGAFESFSNFLERVSSKDLNKKSLESLIKSGALDALGERGQLLANLQAALDYGRETRQSKIQNQSSLFSLMDDKSSLPSLKMESVEPVLFEERLKWEKELLGLYISGSPLAQFKTKLEGKKMTIASIKSFENETPILVAGMIENIKKILTKRGEPMLFLKILDLTDEVEVVVFPRVLESYGRFIKENGCVVIKGKVSLRGGTPSIICNEIREL